VMKAHGGYVSVKSELGKGTTFALHFVGMGEK
jgi:signal transduction histidine kinase